MDFAVPADHKVKIKESEKIDEYRDLARELEKKLWNIRLTVIAIVVGALGTIPKAFEKRGGNWKSDEESGPSQLIALLRLARIFKTLRDNWGLAWLGLMAYQPS